MAVLCIMRLISLLALTVLTFLAQVHAEDIVDKLVVRLTDELPFDALKLWRFRRADVENITLAFGRRKGPAKTDEAKPANPAADEVAVTEGNDPANQLAGLHNQMAGLVQNPEMMKAMQSIMADPAVKEVADGMQKNIHAMVEEQRKEGKGVDQTAVMGNFMQSMMSSMNDPKMLAMFETIGKNLQANPETAPMLDAVAQAQKDALKLIASDPVAKASIEKLQKDGNIEKIYEGLMNNFDMKALTGMMSNLSTRQASIHEVAMSGNATQLKNILDHAKQLGTLKELINSKDDEGRTALHYCGGYGEIECVNCLLAEGADVETTDRDGNTVLHYAASYGQPEVCKKLIESKCNREAKNREKQTALQVAKSLEQDAVVAVLEQKSR